GALAQSKGRRWLLSCGSDHQAGLPDEFCDSAATYQRQTSLATKLAHRLVGAAQEGCPWPWQCLHWWPGWSPILANVVPSGGQESPQPRVTELKQERRPRVRDAGGGSSPSTTHRKGTSSE